MRSSAGPGAGGLRERGGGGALLLSSPQRRSGPQRPPRGVRPVAAGGLSSGRGRGSAQAEMEGRGRQAGPARGRCPPADGERAAGVRHLCILCGKWRGALFVLLRARISRAESVCCFSGEPRSAHCFPLSPANAVVAWLCVTCIAGCMS